MNWAPNVEQEVALELCKRLHDKPYSPYGKKILEITIKKLTAKGEKKLVKALKEHSTHFQVLGDT